MMGESPSRPDYLVRRPTGRGARGQIPRLVQRNRADRSVPIFVARPGSVTSSTSPSAAPASVRRCKNILDRPAVIPIFFANASAPSPSSMTCGDFSITSRARLIGLRICLSLATAPALRVRPSMIEASSSFVPSCVKTAPLPALKSGLSSRAPDRGLDRIETRSTCAGARRSPFLALARVRRDAPSSFSGDISLRSIVPAPP